MKKTFSVSILTILLALVLVNCTNKQENKTTGKGVGNIVITEDIADKCVTVMAPTGADIPYDFFMPIVGEYPIEEIGNTWETTIEFIITESVKKDNYFPKKFTLEPMTKGNKKRMTQYDSGHERYEKLFEETDIIWFHAKDKESITEKLMHASTGEKIKITFTYNFPEDLDEEQKKNFFEDFYTCDIWLDLAGPDCEDENEE